MELRCFLSLPMAGEKFRISKALLIKRCANLISAVCFLFHMCTYIYISILLSENTINVFVSLFFYY
jgi:hypothetical protein